MAMDFEGDFTKGPQLPMTAEKKGLTESELIYHLVRIGAKGDSLSARSIQVFVLTQVRRYRRAGQTKEADNLLEGLKESGYDFQSGVLR